MRDRPPWDNNIICKNMGAAKAAPMFHRVNYFYFTVTVP